MSKKNLLIKSVALTVATSMMGMPIVQNIVPQSITVSAESVAESSQEINQSALDFITKHAKASDYAAWNDTSWDLVMTAAQKEELKQFVDKEVIKNPNTNDLGKAKQIFDWIQSEVKYANGSQMPETNPYKVWKNKVAVCGGYSYIYKAMLNAVGIPSVVVYGRIPSGSSTNGYSLDPAHQWNAIHVDGQWVYSDSTWGGEYFNMSLAQLSQNHTVTNVYQVGYDKDELKIGFENSGMVVTGVKEGTETLTVPATIDNVPVIGISSTFDRSVPIKRIVVGENVRQFDPSSFQFGTVEHVEVSGNNPNYASREGVVFTKDLKEIIYYPENRKESTFTIPKETTTYDSKQTFQNKNLVALSVEEGNPNYSSYKGVLFNKDKTQLLTVPEGASEVTIPGTVKLDNIALGFKHNVRTVIIEDGATYIPSSVFNNTSGLEKLILPSSVTQIDDSAFVNVDLKKVTIVGEKGTVAETYAKKHNIKFATTSDMNTNTGEGELKKIQAEIVDFLSAIPQLNSTDYTKESVQEFTKKFVVLQNIFVQETPSVEDFRKAFDEFKAAYASLVKVKKEDEVTNPVRPSEDKKFEYSVGQSAPTVSLPEGTVPEPEPTEEVSTISPSEDKKFEYSVGQSVLTVSLPEGTVPEPEPTEEVSTIPPSESESVESSVDQSAPTVSLPEGVVPEPEPEPMAEISSVPKDYPQVEDENFEDSVGAGVPTIEITDFEDSVGDNVPSVELTDFEDAVVKESPTVVLPDYTLMELVTDVQISESMIIESKPDETSIESMQGEVLSAEVSAPTKMPEKLPETSETSLLGVVGLALTSIMGAVAVVFRKKS